MCNCDGEEGRKEVIPSFKDEINSFEKNLILLCLLKQCDKTFGEPIRIIMLYSTLADDFKDFFAQDMQEI